MGRNPNIAPARRVGAGKSHQNKLSVVILCAGEGKRIKTYGNKSLFLVGNKKTLIEHQISVIESCYPYCDITVITGFETEKVIEKLPKHIKAVENENYSDTNTIRGAVLGIRVSQCDNLMVLHGDIYFEQSTIDNLTKNGSCILYDKKNLSEENVGCTIQENRLIHMSYGLSPKWAQILYLRGEEYNMFKKISSNRENDKMYLFEGINMILNLNGTMWGIENPGPLFEINTSKDIDILRGL